MKIAIIGHKRIPSNEGGIEKGVEQHAVRMVQRGNDVTVYNRGGHNVFGKEFDGKKLKKYKGINIVTVPTGVNPKFCVNAKLWCKIEQKYFKAGAAQAAAAFSTKITALRGDVKGRGVSLRSSRLLTFRLQPVSPACGRQRTPLTVRELRSSPAAFRSTSS